MAPSSRVKNNGTKAPTGTPRRRWVSLLTALTFGVLSVTGVLAFILPFSITIIGLHALMGFVFIGLIGLHLVNNHKLLTGYLRGPTLWATAAITVVLTALFWWQPGPVKTVLGWSGNLGPAMERFVMAADEMVFDYSPSPDYKLKLTVVTGPSYHVDPPPQVAIWLENQDGYHIKTLLEPGTGAAGHTPYWAFKLAGWERAKRAADEAEPEPIEIDAVSSPTPNASFDPADYILPEATGDSLPYHLLLEINQPGDGQPSLVHAVQIDNRLPRTFQLLELRGYPKRVDDEDDPEDPEEWALYFIDETFDSALDLIDSALLTIERSQ